MVPTHFTVDDERTVLVHLARPNPVWRLIEAQPRVVLTVVDDDAYVPTTWRAAPSGPARDGVPTSYYAAVQLRCQAEIVDDPEDKAELLRRQLRLLQPEQEHAPVSVDNPPYARLLPGIRGLRLHVVDVLAKFKFDDHKPRSTGSPSPTDCSSVTRAATAAPDLSSCVDSRREPG